MYLVANLLCKKSCFFYNNYSPYFYMEWLFAEKDYSMQSTDAISNKTYVEFYFVILFYYEPYIIIII